MKDPRYGRLAELVLDHSLALVPGRVLRIDANAVAAPLIQPLHRGAIERGVHAYTTLGLGGLTELLVAHGSDEQISFVSPMALRGIDTIDAAVTIWAGTHTRSFSRADPGRRQKQVAAPGPGFGRGRGGGGRG